MVNCGVIAHQGSPFYLSSFYLFVVESWSDTRFETLTIHNVTFEIKLLSPWEHDDVQHASFLLKEETLFKNAKANNDDSRKSDSKNIKNSPLLKNIKTANNNNYETTKKGNATDSNSFPSKQNMRDWPTMNNVNITISGSSFIIFDIRWTVYGKGWS